VIPDRSFVHLSVAGIPTGVSFVLGMLHLLGGVALPKPPQGPFLLALLTGTSGSFVFSFVESIRMIGRGMKEGWMCLLGNWIYAVVITAVVTVHLALGR
jgi:hypothetical protein